MRWSAAVVLIALAIPSLCRSQDSVPTQFDVIVVRPSTPGENQMSLQWSSTEWKAKNLPLRLLIAFSNQVEPSLVSGLPAWAESSRWNIDGKVVDPAAKPMDKLSAAERRTLMSSALRDRFGMTTHAENKLQPVFVMTVVSDNLKIKRSPPLPAGQPQPKFGRTQWKMENDVLHVQNATMAQLAEQLTLRMQRNVIDRTGLNGEFDFAFQWPPEYRDRVAVNGGDQDVAPTIFEILKEQLGLKLSADKAPVPTVVVDTILQPEAN
jgi:uncharacterized protein (TIGR03435 family)